MFAPFFCSVGKLRNYGAIFKAQIMTENTENSEEFVNSQSSQLGEDDLQKLEADSVPENTKKTDHGRWRSACKFCGFKPNTLSSTNYAKLSV